MVDKTKRALNESTFEFGRDVVRGNGALVDVKDKERSKHMAVTDFLQLIAALTGDGPGVYVNVCIWRNVKQPRALKRSDYRC